MHDKIYCICNEEFKTEKWNVKYENNHLEKSNKEEYVWHYIIEYQVFQCVVAMLQTFFRYRKNHEDMRTIKCIIIQWDTRNTHQFYIRSQFSRYLSPEGVWQKANFTATSLYLVWFKPTSPLFIVSPYLDPPRTDPRGPTIHPPESLPYHHSYINRQNYNATSDCNELGTNRIRFSTKTEMG